MIGLLFSIVFYCAYCGSKKFQMVPKWFHCGSAVVPNGSTLFKMVQDCSTVVPNGSKLSGIVQLFNGNLYEGMETF